MALTVNWPLDRVRLPLFLADSGSASAAYLALPMRGKIINLGSTLQGTAVGTANNVLTASLIQGGTTTAITHPTWTQLTSGSAAGDVSEVAPTALNQCNAGDVLKIASDGAGSNTTPTIFYADIDPN